jgi:hypothetical protein
MPRDLDFKYLIKIPEQNRLTKGPDICDEANIYLWISLIVFSEKILPFGSQHQNRTEYVCIICMLEQGYDHVQAYLGICQKKLYVKKIYVKKIYVKKSRAQFLYFVYFSHVTSILGFTKLLK